MNQIHFVWGAGGVGKSHVALRTASLLHGKKLLMTLDPSPRIFELLKLSTQATQQKVSLAGAEFEIKRADSGELFQRLSEIKAPNETVKHYFDQMVKGLHRFRDYLGLLELAEVINESRFDHIIVDTPPFEEAKGLHQAMLQLREFFDKSLVQMAVRNSILQIGVRKVVELCQIFVGKRAMDETLQFLDWLLLHLERFQKAARLLESRIFAEDTVHRLVIHPRSSPTELQILQSFFTRAHHLQVVLNRSVEHLDIPNSPDQFFKELLKEKESEKKTVELLKSLFSEFELERIPLQVMGDDTREELEAFILGETPSWAASKHQ